MRRVLNAFHDYTVVSSSSSSS